MKFTTNDRKQDIMPWSMNMNCAILLGTCGWWHNWCTQSLLTGHNQPGPSAIDPSNFYHLPYKNYGIFWYFNGIPGIDKVGNSFELT
jgi:hypothetical protein